MTFRDRTDAAEQLATRLTAGYANDKNTVVVAIPRGGVPIASIIANKLHLPLDVAIVKKIGHPTNPEFAIGSVSLIGVVLNDAAAGIPAEYLQNEVKRLELEIQNRYSQFRQGRIPLQLEDKNVIIVDDGVATGSTLLATISLVKNMNPSRVIVAIPVAPQETADMIKENADELYILSTPSGFMSVGQFYEFFPQVSDEEVLALLRIGTTASE